MLNVAEACVKDRRGRTGSEAVVRRAPETAGTPNRPA